MKPVYGTVGTWMQFSLYHRKILIGALLFCLLIITFCIRIQGVACHHDV